MNFNLPIRMIVATLAIVYLFIGIPVLSQSTSTGTSTPPRPLPTSTPTSTQIATPRVSVDFINYKKAPYKVGLVILDRSNNEFYFDILRSTTSSSTGFTYLDRVPSSCILCTSKIEYYTDSGLKYGGVYYYKVIARNQIRQSSNFSEVVTARILSRPRPLPTSTPTSTPPRPLPTSTPTSTPPRPLPTSTPTSTPPRPLPTSTPTSTPPRPLPTSTPTSTPSSTSRDVTQTQDTTPPAIKILVPNLIGNSATSLKKSLPPIVAEITDGTGSGIVTSSVRWTNTTSGSSGSLNKTNNGWVSRDVSLATGSNNIIITAKDKANNIATINFTIIYDATPATPATPVANVLKGLRNILNTLGSVIW